MAKDLVDYDREATWFGQTADSIKKRPYNDSELIAKADALEDIGIEASLVQNALFGMDSAGTSRGFDYRTLHPIDCEREAEWMEKAGDAAQDVGMYLGDKICLEKAIELYTTAMQDYEMGGKPSNSERVSLKLISLQSELAKKGHI
ncbi:MAG: hypothetical protein MUP55_04405 [Candidatus Aenigmarchaeota archaeon]|nr:hypothetical protein [Candidatus Aenigmarchaeota archaeon]